MVLRWQFVTSMMATFTVGAAHVLPHSVLTAVGDMWKLRLSPLPKVTEYLQ